MGSKLSCYSINACYAFSPTPNEAKTTLYLGNRSTTNSNHLLLISKDVKIHKPRGCSRPKWECFRVDIPAARQVGLLGGNVRM